MKTKRNILRVLTAVGAVVSTVAGFDLTGVMDVVPDGHAKFLVAAAPLCLAIKEVVVVVGDWLDNGVRDNSFRL